MQEQIRSVFSELICRNNHDPEILFEVIHMLWVVLLYLFLMFLMLSSLRTFLSILWAGWRMFGPKFSLIMSPFPLPHSVSTNSSVLHKLLLLYSRYYPLLNLGILCHLSAAFDNVNHCLFSNLGLNQRTFSVLWVMLLLRPLGWVSVSSRGLCSALFCSPFICFSLARLVKNLMWCTSVRHKTTDCWSE